MTNSAKGIALGTAAATLWGSTYVAIRLLYGFSDLNAVEITFARYLVGGLALAVFMAARGEGKQLALFYRAPRPFLLLGATGIAGMGVLVAVASALTATVNVSLLLNANPLFIALSAPLIGERLTKRRLLGAAIGLAGVAIVVVGESGNGLSLAGRRDLWGTLAAIAAGIAWATYTLFGKGPVRHYGGLLTTTLAMLWGALLILPFVLVGHWPQHLSPEAIWVLLYLGLVPTALAFTFWYWALTLIDATMLAPAQYLSPLSTVVLAWSILGEHIGLSIFLGMLCIFIGIALASHEHGGGT